MDFRHDRYICVSFFNHIHVFSFADIFFELRFFISHRSVGFDIRFFVCFPLRSCNLLHFRSPESAVTTWYRNPRFSPLSSEWDQCSYIVCLGKYQLLRYFTVHAICTLYPVFSWDYAYGRLSYALKVGIRVCLA